MELTQTLMLSIAVAAMVFGIFLTFIPFIPGAVIVWGIAIITAFADHFDRITVLAAIIMTALMILCETRDFWLPIFGVKMAGLSCLTSIGAMIGGMIGAFVIPLPIINALIGSVIGAVIVELISVRKIARGVKAGTTAATIFLISYVLELAAVFAIFIVFLLSITLTQ